MEQFKENPELSEKELEQIIFLSYMFSQGSLSLQKTLIKEIIKISGRQDLAKTKQVFEKFTDSLKYTNGGGFSLSRTQVHEGEISDPKEHFRDISGLTGEELLIPIDDLQEIIDTMWERDHLFLCERNGRPNRKEEGFKPDTIQDPYFSFGVAYLLNDTDTPSKTFNQLLEHLRQHDVSELVKEKKQAVIEAYKKHHPESSFNNI